MTYLAHIHSRRFYISVYLTFLVGICDQISKSWVMSSVKPYHHVEITPFFNIVLISNRGVTFGLMNQLGETYVAYLLISVAAVVVFFLSRWLWKTDSTPIALGLGLVIGGAIGNVIDRIRYGAVVDFLDFHIADYHWYAFNIADAAIVIGVGLLLLDSLLRAR